MDRFFPIMTQAWKEKPSGFGPVDFKLGLDIPSLGFRGFFPIVPKLEQKTTVFLFHPMLGFAWV